MFFARSRAYASLVKAATHLIESAAPLSDPGKHLLQYLGFFKEDVKAGLSTPFLLVHIAEALGRMAQDPHSPQLGGMAFASPAPFQKFGSFIFSNNALVLQKQ